MMPLTRNSYHPRLQWQAILTNARRLIYLEPPYCRMFHSMEASYLLRDSTFSALLKRFIIRYLCMRLFHNVSGNSPVSPGFQAALRAMLVHGETRLRPHELLKLPPLLQAWRNSCSDRIPTNHTLPSRVLGRPDRGNESNIPIAI